MRLSASTEAAIAAVRARALGERDARRRRIEVLLVAEGLSADVATLCRSAVDQARVTLNFHPDRLLADGRTVAEALRDEGVYRSQFETRISNGGLTAYPGGDRDEWERRLFGGAYHAPVRNAADAVRPKYGGLNLAGFANGPAPAFGSCALVLGRDAAARTTFLFGDSSESYDDLGTADAFEPVLAALLDRVAATGQMVGLPGVSVGGVVKRLGGGPEGPAPFSRALDDYIETHTHGPIDLAPAAEARLLDPSYRDTQTGMALLDTADRYRLRVGWHAGSVLSLAEFPSTTPVRTDAQRTRWQEFLLSGSAERLAARVASEVDSDRPVLTAAAIGSAAGDFVRRPGRWREWGAPDPSLTVFKDLWRILTMHGSALTVTTEETRP